MMNIIELGIDMLIAVATHSIIREIVILRVRIATLDHKARNDAMKIGGIVKVALCKVDYICDVIRSGFFEKLELNRSFLRNDDQVPLWMCSVLVEFGTGDRRFVGAGAHNV